MTRMDEHYCVKPKARCPECGSEDIYYDNHERNIWGYFRDAHCADCNYWWCEESLYPFDTTDDDVEPLR